MSEVRAPDAHSTTSSSPRRLLVVTYHFPPIQSAGVYRVVGLVKYLRARGWQVSVLTVSRSSQEGIDRSSLEMIPDGVDVIRTEAAEPAAVVLRAAGAPAPADAADGEPAAVPARPAAPRSVLRRAFARPGRVLVRALSYPDVQIGWAPRVAREVTAFVRRYPDAVVLSSTPPHSTQIGVRWARTRARFPWVADFRDPWTAPLRQPKGRVNLAAQRALERWVLFGCDRVVANTIGNRDALLSAFPRLDPARVRVVPNAFDTETMPPAADAGDPALACDIAYFGEIYPGMLDAYFEALRVLVAREAASAPRLHVFGRVDAADVHRVAQSGLGSHIVFKGVVSYARSLALMRSARSLLLLLPDGESMATCVPSKLYPYLFTGRPVLAFVPPGDAARVVEETDSGEVVTPGEPAATAERLRAFVERVRRGESGGAGRGNARDRYAMDRVAGDIHAILEEVAARV